MKKRSIALIGALFCIASFALAGTAPPTTGIETAPRREIAVELNSVPVMAVPAITMPSAVKVAPQDPPAPSTWSAANYWDFRTGESYLVALRTIGPVDRPFGLNIHLDIKAFAGVNLKGETAAGLGLIYSKNISDRLWFEMGPATTWKFGDPLRDAGVGLILGLGYSF